VHLLRECPFACASLKIIPPPQVKPELPGFTPNFVPVFTAKKAFLSGSSVMKIEHLSLMLQIFDTSGGA